MADTKTIRRRRDNRLSISAVRRLVSDWLTVENTASQFAGRASEMKVLLRDTILPAQGDSDDQGHVWIEFDEPVEDPSGKASVLGIKREKRVSRRLNPARAEEFLKRRKLWDDCTETVLVINEDAILAKAFEKKISDADLEGLYDVNESYAFVPKRR